MKWEYYLSPWNNNKEFKEKIIINSDTKLYKYCRKYDGKKAVFYTDTSFSEREMYIYLGTALEEMIQLVSEIEDKCAPVSVYLAFKNSSNIYYWIRYFLEGKTTPIVKLSTDEGDIYCLHMRYSNIFDSKESTFKKLCEIVDTFRKESVLINKKELKPKEGLDPKTKKILKTVGKVAIRAALIILVSGVIDFELPDFGGDIGDADIPDFDISDTDFTDINVPDAGIDIPAVDADIVDDIPSEHNRLSRTRLFPTFLGRNRPSSSREDGYIHDGDVILTRNISKIKEKFKLYKKDGKRYIKVGNLYKRIDGPNKTFKVNHIEYKSL